MGDITQQMEQLGEQLMFLDTGDWQSLLATQQAAQAAAQQAEGDLRTGLADIAAAIEAIIQEAVPDMAAASAWLEQSFAALQKNLAGEASPILERPAWAVGYVQQDSSMDLLPSQEGRAEPSSALEEGASKEGKEPEGDSCDPDDPIWRDFASRTLSTLDFLQERLLEWEQGLEVGRAQADWRREIHTIKGESGMLGCAALHRVCTAMEELLYSEPQTGHFAPLYRTLDWIRQCLDPQQSVLAASEEGSEQLSEEGVIADMQAALPDRSQIAYPLRADPSMLAEFVTEAHEHLENADVSLLEIETAEHPQEAINALFRSFHTMKGLAGFMELAPIQELAHETETFLDHCRNHRMNATAVDLIFSAIDGLKHLNKSLREAVEGGSTSILVPSDHPALCQRVKQACLERHAFFDDEVDPEGAEEEQLPEGIPRLGEILCEQGVITEEHLTRALRRQQVAEPGLATPRLGEVLLREHLVEAKDISQALRRQREQTARPTNVRESVKVDSLRLDRLVDAIGELVIAESMVSQDQDVQTLAQGGTELSRRLSLLSKITRELQEIATSLRMVPIRATFQRMARLARDVANRTGKKVDFRMYGEDTELDKNVVDRIGDPLVHMVRNAIDHGLEPDADARRAANKNSTGKVELKAFHQGGNICIQISDDGRGMDRERLLAKALSKELISEAEAAEMSDADVYRMIFHPGFSTAEQVSDLSGRGVGMDVVKKTINELRGQVDIDSVLGRGSIFTIRLPLTLAIIDGMVCGVGHERYIIPTLSITRSLRPRKEQLSTALGRGEMLSLHGEIIPILRVHTLLGVDGAEQDATQALLVIIDTGERKAALQVDQLLGKQQIVIKSLGDALRAIPGVSGGAIMSDGSVGLIVDPTALVDRAHEETAVGA